MSSPPGPSPPDPASSRLLLQKAGPPAEHPVGAVLYGPPGVGVGPGLGGPTPVCIPSPYADSSQEYAPPPHPHGPPLAFYSSALVAYEQQQQPMGEAGSGSGPPLSPSLFWPAQTHPHHHHRHAHPGMTLLHCQGPPPPPLGYGDAPPAFHHGGHWVEAFFKRSIQGTSQGLGSQGPGSQGPGSQGHNDYICPATNQCTIDKNRRKSCQACRLRRCYEVGMVKCGVRRERCSYRGARQRRGDGGGARDPGAGGPGRAGGRVRLDVPLDGPLHLEGPLLSFLPPLGREGGRPRHCPAPMSPQHFIQRIMEAEPPDIYLTEQLEKPFTQTSMMMSLTHLADKELVLMITWAKKIPGFVELSLADQIRLLKCCWLEVLMLGLMWRSVDHPGKLIFSPDLKLNRPSREMAQTSPSITRSSSRSRRFRLSSSSAVSGTLVHMSGGDQGNRGTPPTPRNTSY
ncbi:hypothetical protein CRUP_035226 [Coryphaenoides rupestris]|nr:hypothetical protein CRUP_035226 [Coryphaenoides rupestris]